jgi:arginase
MGLGPEQLLVGGIRSLIEKLGHSLTVEEVTPADGYSAEIKTAFALLREVSNRVREVRQKESFPLVLSGNCNTAVGAVAGCGSENTAVIWFDAHGEATTPETTNSGFLDGMGISILAGQCWRRLAASIPEFEPIPGERILLVGSRDVEPAEESLLGELRVGRASDLQGLSAQLARLLPGIEGVYVHVDLDVLDPCEAIANQWTSPGGLTVQTLLDAVKVIRNQVWIKGLGIASYDPNEDRNGIALKAACSVVEAVVG